MDDLKKKYSQQKEGNNPAEKGLDATNRAVRHLADSQVHHRDKHSEFGVVNAYNEAKAISEEYKNQTQMGSVDKEYKQTYKEAMQTTAEGREALKRMEAGVDETTAGGPSTARHEQTGDTILGRDEKRFGNSGLGTQETHETQYTRDARYGESVKYEQSSKNPLATGEAKESFNGVSGEQSSTQKLSTGKTAEEYKGIKEETFKLKDESIDVKGLGGLRTSQGPELNEDSQTLGAGLATRYSGEKVGKNNNSFDAFDQMSDRYDGAYNPRISGNDDGKSFKLGKEETFILNEKTAGGTVAGLRTGVNEQSKDGKTTNILDRFSLDMADSSNGTMNKSAVRPNTSTGGDSLDAPILTLVDDEGTNVEMNVGDAIMLSNGAVLLYDVDESGTGVLMTNYFNNENIAGKGNRLGENGFVANEMTAATLTNANKIEVSEIIGEDGNPIKILDLSDEMQGKVKQIATKIRGNTQLGGGTSASDIIKTNPKLRWSQATANKAKTIAKINLGSVVIVKGATFATSKVLKGASYMSKGMGYQGPEVQFVGETLTDMTKKAVTKAGVVTGKKTIKKVNNSKPVTAIKGKAKTFTVKVGRSGINAFTSSRFGSSLKNAYKGVSGKVLNSTIVKSMGKFASPIRKLFSIFGSAKRKIKQFILVAIALCMVLMAAGAMVAAIINCIQSILFFWVDDRTELEKVTDFIEEVNTSYDGLMSDWQTSGKTPPNTSGVDTSMSSIQLFNTEAEGITISNDPGCFTAKTTTKKNDTATYEINTGKEGSGAKKTVTAYNIAPTYEGSLNGINWKAFWCLVQLYELGVNNDEYKTEEMFDTSRPIYLNFKSCWGRGSEYSGKFIDANVTAGVDANLFIDSSGNLVTEKEFNNYLKILQSYNKGETISKKQKKFQEDTNKQYSKYRSYYSSSQVSSYMKSTFPNIYWMFKKKNGDSFKSKTAFNNYVRQIEDDREIGENLSDLLRKNIKLKGLGYYQNEMKKNPSKDSLYSGEKYPDTSGDNGNYLSVYNEYKKKNINPNDVTSPVYVQRAIQAEYYLSDSGDQSLTNYTSFFSTQYFNKIQVGTKYDGTPEYEYRQYTLDDDEVEMLNTLYYESAEIFDAFEGMTDSEGRDMKELMISYCGGMFADGSLGGNFDYGGNMDAVAFELWTTLKKEGFSEASAAGIIGNAYQESRLNPASGSDGGPAYGIFQFEKSKHGTSPFGGKGSLDGKGLDEQLIEYCGSHGLDYSSVEGQTKFMLSKLPSDFENYTGKTYTYKNGTVTWWPEKMTLDEYKEIDDPQLAAQIFCRVHERPSKPMMSVRESAAQRYYTLLKSYGEGSSSSDIINVALKYVGNPYVYGGNNLETGIDCSHFVYQILKMTGHYNGGYTTSTNWRNLGMAVSGGLQNALPGDVLVWDGHVAFYMGGNQIVHASNSQPYPKGGIKVSSISNLQTYHGGLLAVRRFP